ncbi:GNAT family N-acetyltransferase [Psychromonas ossibalaenae]|uniref:GNAT family N-acetyltransferase n=1 Tax=Psychromonas ossibalaenae TaxID=444922 RepID=UPI000370C7DA|nr:GNAT family protein [Psychromonas ossibalaenae]
MLKTPLLTGKQIYLKALMQTDVTDEYVQWLNDSSINQFLESRYQTQTAASCRHFVGELQSQNNNCFWGIYCNQSKQHIGNIKLGPVNKLYQRATIGLLIGNKSYWGKGIATEAINLVSDFAFQKLSLHKIDAGCYVSNQGSKKAFLKAGYQVEGLLKDHFFYQNKFEHCVLLGKICENSQKDTQ